MCLRTKRAWAFILFHTSITRAMNYYPKLVEFLETKTNSGLDNVIFLNSPERTCIDNQNCGVIYASLKTYPTGFLAYGTDMLSSCLPSSTSLVVMMDFAEHLNYPELESQKIETHHLWLIHANSENNEIDLIKKYLLTLDLRLDSEVYIIDTKFTLTHKLLEVYKTSEGGRLIVQEIDVITCQSIWRRRRDLMGMTLEVGLVNDKYIYLKDTDDTKLRGIEGENFNLLMRDMNFSANFKLATSYGNQIDEKSKSMASLLHQGIVNVSASLLTQTIERDSHLDFAQFGVNRLKIAYQKQVSYSYNTFIGVFSQSYREGEAKFLRCSLYYEGAFSIMEPAEFSSISL